MSVADDIRQRLDIVDLVSGYVPLKKAGRNHKGLCPFHTEKTPSFTVNPERQTWRCFGACATGGDVFSFLMLKEGLDFGEALRQLADTAGVELKPRPQAHIDREEALFSVNALAARFYNEALRSPEGKRALDYLHGRGIDDKSIEKFQIGYSPSGRNGLREHLASMDGDLARAAEAGLLRTDDQGRARDFFFGRLMTPIADRRGRVAGFGGRSLDGSQPKYINTPATPIFDKQGMLYGLDKASAPIRQQETAVIVEGYMDVIAAHQHGRRNVIASMGTALTERQVAVVKPLTKTVALALDSDAAGQEATLRSLEASWRALERRRLGQREQVKLLIAALPEGKDPDDLIRQDPERWDAAIASAVPYVEFLIPMFARRHDLESTQGQAAAAEALLPMILSVGNPFEQDRYFEILAKTLGVTREALQASLGRLRLPVRERSRSAPRPKQPRPGAGESALAASTRDPLEEYVLAALVRWPDLREWAAEHAPAPDVFLQSENREIFTRALECATIEELRQLLDDSLLERLAELSQRDMAPTDRDTAPRAIQQALNRLEQRRLRNQQAEILDSLELSPDTPRPADAERSIVDVNKRLAATYRSSASETSRQ